MQRGTQKSEQPNWGPWGETLFQNSLQTSGAPPPSYFKMPSNLDIKILCTPHLIVFISNCTRTAFVAVVFCHQELVGGHFIKRVMVPILPSSFPVWELLTFSVLSQAFLPTLDTEGCF